MFRTTLLGLGLAAAAQAAAAQATLRPLGELDPAPAIVDELLADTDGDGRVELLLLAADGSVLRHGLDASGAFVARGSWALPDPAHSLLDVADLLPRPGVELVVVDSTGATALAWPAAGEPTRTALPRRARCTLRTGTPQLRRFLQDLDQDGRLDLLLPTLQGVLPFQQEAPDADGALRFRALPLLPVPVAVTTDRAGPALDDDHQGGLTVPRIETTDLNGDGRPDLLTQSGSRRGFHLQAADGTFQPPLELDLEQFVDSTPKATLAPGATVVLGDRQLLQRGDVDGDGIPDFVIAHRRKVWTFLGGKGGPQFTKARTQAVADDTSAMLVLDLDDDQRADLLTFQVQVPGVGALLLGLVQSIDISIRAVGHRSEANGFAAAPAWRRTLVLRIPPLLSLLSRQDELVQRFTDVLGKARLGASGALLQPASHDLVQVTEDGSALELHADTKPQPGLDSRTGRRLLRELLFDDPNPVFDLDRILDLVSGLVSGRQQRLVGDAAVAATVPLRPTADWRTTRLLVGDFDGRPGDELLVVHQRTGAERSRAYVLLGAAR